MSEDEGPKKLIDKMGLKASGLTHITMVGYLRKLKLKQEEKYKAS